MGGGLGSGALQLGGPRLQIRNPDDCGLPVHGGNHVLAVVCGSAEGGGGAKTVYALDAAIPVGVAWVAWGIVDVAPFK